MVKSLKERIELQEKNLAVLKEKYAKNGLQRLNSLSRKINKNLKDYDNDKNTTPLIDLSKEDFDKLATEIAEDYYVLHGFKINDPVKFRETIINVLKKMGDRKAEKVEKSSQRNFSRNNGNKVAKR